MLDTSRYLKDINLFLICIIIFLLILLIMKNCSQSMQNEIEPYKNDDINTNTNSSAPIKILYIIRSIPKYYESRLKVQKDTWMTYLTDNDDVLVASDDLNHVNMYGLKYSTPSGCPRNHGDGPCCSESNAILKALNEHTFDWAFILDDDVYAYPPKVREVIERYLHKPYAALGTVGCVAENIKGFCGGGGYAFSRLALEKIVGYNQTAFLKTYKTHCDKTQFCDITTADLAAKKNIELITVDEFKPWGIKKNEKHLISENKIATLHYYGGKLTEDYKEIPDKMRYLHNLFTLLNNSNN